MELACIRYWKETREIDCQNSLSLYGFFHLGEKKYHSVEQVGLLMESQRVPALPLHEQGGGKANCGGGRRVGRSVGALQHSCGKNVPLFRHLWGYQELLLLLFQLPRIP